LYHNRREKIEVAQAFNAQYRDLDQLLQQSDFIVVAVDLNTESKALIGAEQFDLMQKHAVFVNIARGSVVDEHALIEALQQNKIFAAGLDVYAKEPLQSSPLFELPNAVTAPHIGSATAETRQKMVDLAYQNLIDALEDRTPRYLVNPKFE
jgi:gluconate 2-dehydrogenase